MSKKLYELEIPIGKLFEFLGCLDIDMNKEIEIDRELFILNKNDEFTEVTHLIKKEGNVREYYFDDNISIKCDENHLVQNELGEYKQIDNLNKIKTDSGIKKLKEKTDFCKKEVFDLMMKEIHEYKLPNGIINHNTTIAKILINKIAPNNHLYINASDKNSVDNVRDDIINFASSIGFGGQKVVFLDECLDENEKVKIGTPENHDYKKLKELEKDTVYPIVSVNLDTGEKEADKGIIVTDKKNEIYEVELDDGRTIRVNNEHPFIVENNNGELKEKKLKNLNEGDEIITPQGGFSFYGIKIKSIKKVGKGKVRNLNVLKNHTFLTENDILTHNCDYFSPNAQGALRNPLEEFSGTTRFIMTANYRDKLIDPIQSRLNIYTIKPMDRKRMVKYAVDILKKEDVEFEIEDVVEIVKNYSPDLRKIVKTLQRHNRNGKLDIGEGELISEDYKTEILELLFENNKSNEKLIKEIRQIIADSNINRFEEIYSYIYDNIHKVTDNPLDYYIKLSEYMYRDSIVVDKEINFMGMISDILED